MARRHHYRRLDKETPNLDMTTFMNLMVVLTPFLLITAVFSRITIVELELPSSASGGVSEPTFRLEVIVREEGFELTNGSALIATIPKVKGEYDMKALGELALALKRDYPDADDASVLLQPDIAYDHLIQVMDAIRSAEVPRELATGYAVEPAAIEPAAAESAAARAEAGKAGVETAAAPKTVRVDLFTDIAVGDAP